MKKFLVILLTLILLLGAVSCTRTVYVPIQTPTPVQQPVVTQVALPSNQAPIANIGGPYEVYEGESVVLQGAVSDPDGDAISWKWWLNSNEIGSLSATDNIPNPIFYARAVAQDTFINCTLTATDSRGATSRAETTIKIKDKVVYQPPPFPINYCASITAWVEPEFVCLGREVWIKGRSSVCGTVRLEVDGRYIGTISTDAAGNFSYVFYVTYDFPKRHTVRAILQGACEVASVTATFETASCDPCCGPCLSPPCYQFPPVPPLCPDCGPIIKPPPPPGLPPGGSPPGGGCSGGSCGGGNPVQRPN